MRRRTRRRRSRLRGRRGTTVVSPCSSLTTRTLTGLRLYHAHIVNSFQLKNIRSKNTTLYQIYCLQLFYISDIVSAVFPWQENPHRLGPSGGAGRVQGADGKTIPKSSKILLRLFWKIQNVCSGHGQQWVRGDSMFASSQGWKVEVILFKPFPFLISS